MMFSQEELYSSNGEELILHHNVFNSFSIQDFLSLPWQQNTIRVFGKEHLEPRLTCYFGPAYSYSNVHWKANELPPILFQLKQEIEHLAQAEFNAVLCNYYRDGQDSMGWHSDNEKEMDSSCIASVSIGAERVLKFKSRSDKKTLSFSLPHGSLLVMNNFQTNWQHAIGKVKSASPRINFTFRKIYS
jgi:alkylated DNA repair dioxygenase AlkB